MSKIKEGTYEAKIIGSFLGESKDKKTPYAGMTFQFEQDGMTKTMEWVGWLTPNAIEGTTKTLVECGYLGRSLADLAGDHNFADIQGISIVIEHETYVNTAGEQKLRPRIKWVNVGSGFYEKFDHQQAKVKIGAQFDGYLLKARREVSTPMKKEPSGYNHGAGQSQMLTADDVPF